MQGEGDVMERTHDYLLALGRVLMSGLFVWGGYGKLMAASATTQSFTEVGVPLPGLMVWVATLVELVGGIMLLVGFKTQWVAGVLAIWTLITGFAVHLVAGVSAADGKRCSATLRRSEIRVAVAVPRTTASIHRCASAASRSPGV